jgi:hypothetical protein
MVPFPTGCYNLCPPPGGFVIHGPIIPFEKWWYTNGGGIVNSGGPGHVPPLTITGSGLYGMGLYNGWCEAGIGVLDLTVPDDCDRVPSCEGTFEMFLNQVHYSPSCKMSIEVSITNPFGVNIPIQVVALSPGGSMTPSSMTIAPGFNFITSQWTPPAPFTGNAVFRIIFALPDGTVCSQDVYVYNIKCPYTGGPVYRMAARPEGAAAAVANEAALLTLVPNPAQHATTVQYRFGSSATKRAVQVFDVTGRLMAALDAPEAAGQWPINLGNWAAGVYQVVLKADGKAVATSRLSVTH